MPPKKPNSSKSQGGKVSGPQVNSDPNAVEEEDDSIIGTMFWKSIGLITLLALCSAGIYFATRPKTLASPNVKTEAKMPEVRKVEPTTVIPEIPFSDVTQESGIQFVHFNGMDGERLLPETMGGGGGFLDYDNDGDQDILLVSSTRWSWSQIDDSKVPSSSLTLYQNDGKGHFKDVTEEAGLTGRFYGMGPAFGDFNNDGWVDIFVTCVGLNRLYQNDHGKFTEVSEKLGVAGSAEQWSCPAAWLDFDKDGLLDLVVGNYVTWNREIDLSLASTLAGLKRAYGQPTNFKGAHMYLYRNTGNGFTDVAEQAGLHRINPATKVPIAKSLGIIIVDPNRDGWPDICVANDTVENFMLVNNKDGTFEEQGTRMGVALNRDGQATGAMGIDCAFLCNDDRCAIGIGNFANEQSSLYVSEGKRPLFSDLASTTGFGPQTKLLLTFGLFFADMDLDGNQDIICSNGHLEPEIQTVQPTQQFEQPPQLFWNKGNLQLFLLDAKKTGAAFQKPMVGRGAAYADVDGDGDLDILLMANGGPARLLRNDQTLGHHWLRVKLKDAKGSDAIGAKIELPWNNKTQTRVIGTTRSYLSQTEPVATFGLGQFEPKEMTVTWPDGSTQNVAIDKVDTLMVVQQAASKAE